MEQSTEIGSARVTVTFASGRRLPNVKLYVTPYIGDTRLQDLTPVRLSLLYAHLLDHGRPRRGRPGTKDDRERPPHAAPGAP